MTATVWQQATKVTGHFDPLADLDGLWTVEMAERYLPIPGMPLTKYECWDGKLFMTPYEGAQNSFGEMKLGRLFAKGAEANGFYVCGPLNLMLGAPGRWIQPDVTVLDAPVRGTWISSERAVLVVEFVSPESRKRDRIDKPAKCAAVGIPHYMTVEIRDEYDQVLVELFDLKDGKYHSNGIAQAGTRFVMSKPFAAEFDPSELLMR